MNLSSTSTPNDVSDLDSMAVSSVGGQFVVDVCVTTLQDECIHEKSMSISITDVLLSQRSILLSTCHVDIG